MADEAKPQYCGNCNNETAYTVLNSEVIRKDLVTYSDGVIRGVSNTKVSKQCTPCGTKRWSIEDSFVYEIKDGIERRVA